MQHHTAHRKEGKKFVLVLSSKLSQLSKVESFLAKANSAMHLDEVQFNKLYLAASEAVTNGILHGNKQDPARKVTLVCEVGPKSVTLRVRDEGNGYDFATIASPLDKDNLTKESGRGIFLMRTLMDAVRFQKHDGGIEVVMKMIRHQPPRIDIRM